VEERIDWCLAGVVVTGVEEWSGRRKRSGNDDYGFGREGQGGGHNVVLGQGAILIRVWEGDANDHIYVSH
jgi:hypothetical protein